MEQSYILYRTFMYMSGNWEYHAITMMYMEVKFAMFTD